MLSVDNHNWFNKQSREEQERLNKIFQDYKLGVIELTSEGIKQAEVIQLSIDDYIEIPAYDFTEKEYLEYKRKRNERVYRKFEVERDV